MRRVPVLRHGVPYRSLDTRAVTHPRSGTLLAEVSLANAGLVRRDARRPIIDAPSPEVISAALRGAAALLHEPLPLDAEEAPVDLDEHRMLVTATTGLRAAVIDHQLDLLSEALADLADRVPDVLPATTRRLAVILPSNAPAVNRAWLPAVALGAAVAVKPGARDPWTPSRLVAALVAAGLPADLFSLYPSDHETTAALMSAWPRVQLFGDDAIAERHRGNPHVQVNGPGRSAVVVGDGVDWTTWMDALVDGIVRHGGRSCLNTSSIATLGGAEVARALADALAERLGPVPVEEVTRLPDAERATAIDAAITDALDTPGAEDVTARQRETRRLERDYQQRALLRPTVVRCDDPTHPLSRTEWPFSFVSVTAVDADELPTWLGETLSVATLGLERDLVEPLANTPAIERLSPDAPHSLDTSMASLHLARMAELLR